MRHIYIFLLATAVAFALQAVPALGGEYDNPTRSSTERMSSHWEKPSVPFSYSPAPPHRHRIAYDRDYERKASRDVRSPDEPMTARNYEVSTPLSFSPAPPARHERESMLSKKKETAREALAAKRLHEESERLGPMERTSAPRGFFPVRDRECVYRAC